MIVFLLEGVELTECVVNTTQYAVLDMPTLQFIGVNKLPLAFMTFVTFSCRATVMESLHEKEHLIWKHYAYRLCPLMHSGQIPGSG